jgi:thioredoxin-like negative regulator of GroEL
MSTDAPADAVTITAPAGVPRRPSLLFFFDPRSGKSRRVEGFLAQVLQHRRNHDTFHLYRVDVTQHPDLATKFKVGTVPTLVVVENKQVMARFQQPRGARELTRFLQPWLR